MQNEAEIRNDTPRPSLIDAMDLSAQRSEEALDRLIALLARLGSAPIAAIWVLQGERQFLASAIGPLPREIPRGSSFAEQALHQEDMLLVEDARKDARFARDVLVTGAPRLRFFAGLGLRGRNRERIGALCLMDTQARALDDNGRAALHDLRVILEDRLRLRADVLHDPQSGAHARRPFEDIAAQEWRRAMRGLVPISLIVAELDRAEGFASNEVAMTRGMRATALAMQYSTNRPSDCVCRYDASRFVLLLPGTDVHGATATAERVRIAVETLVIPLSDTTAGTLTISQGVEIVTSEALSRGSLEESVQAASVALREAQQAGGNRWAMTVGARRLAKKTPH